MGELDPRHELDPDLTLFDPDELDAWLAELLGSPPPAAPPVDAGRPSRSGSYRGRWPAWLPGRPPRWQVRRLAGWSAGRKLLALGLVALVVVVGIAAVTAAGVNGVFEVTRSRAPAVAPPAAGPVSLSGPWQLEVTSHRIPDGVTTDRTLVHPMRGACNGAGPCAINLGFGFLQLSATGNGYTYSGTTRQRNANPSCPSGVWTVALNMTISLADPARPVSRASFQIVPAEFVRSGRANGRSAVTCDYSGEVGTWSGTPVGPGSSHPVSRSILAISD